MAVLLFCDDRKTLPLKTTKYHYSLHVNILFLYTYIEYRLAAPQLAEFLKKILPKIFFFFLVYFMFSLINALVYVCDI